MPLIEITCRKSWHEEAWSENQRAKSCTWSRSDADFHTPSHPQKQLENCQRTKTKHCYPLTPKSWLSRRPLRTVLRTPPWDKAPSTATKGFELSPRNCKVLVLLSVDNALIRWAKAGCCSLLFWAYTIAMLEKKSPSLPPYPLLLRTADACMGGSQAGPWGFI